MRKRKGKLSLPNKKKWGQKKKMTPLKKVLGSLSDPSLWWNNEGGGGERTSIGQRGKGRARKNKNASTLHAAQTLSLKDSETIASREEPRVVRFGGVGTT